MPLLLVPPAAPVTCHDDRGVDLGARRRAAEAAVRSAAQAPVRHLPAALLDALQGSWGTPEELLGVGRRPGHLTVAR